MLFFFRTPLSDGPLLLALAHPFDFLLSSSSKAQIKEAVALFDEFKKLFAAGDAKLDAAAAHLGKLKLLMLNFTSLPPASPSAPSEAQMQELLLAREILEHGALLSVKTMDIPAFERYVAQLKIYYADCAATLPASQRQYPILGLNLLRLLAQNRIAEFHTELEIIPADLQSSNVYIKYPAQLEQHIMEGSYNKVLSAKRDNLFANDGMYFLDLLVGTVREEIADCSEKAYSSISAAELQKLLMLNSKAELSEFADARGWDIEGATVTFAKMEEEPLTAKLPSTKLIQQTLSYAKELERIV